MKKTLILLAVLLVAAVVIVAIVGGGTPKTEVPEIVEPSLAPEVTVAPAEGDIQPVAGVDYEAIYASHEPDEIVMSIDGKDVTWKDYCYVLVSRAVDLEQQFQMYQYYGYAMGWESQADEEGHSYAELLPGMVEDFLTQMVTIEKMAEANGVTLSQEEEAALQEMHEGNIASFCGEGATEEDFDAFLDSIHLDKALYERMNRVNALYQAGFKSIYGENAEKLDEQEARAQLEKDGIVSADHILLATIDLNTREALDEATVAEKLALAQQIAEELRAIEDPEERAARFAELKEEHNEDPGSAAGYVFGPGVMAQEFYDGTLALEPGEVSEPVLSSYGYHIILRRDVDLDTELTGGQGYTGRTNSAWMIYSAKLDAILEQVSESLRYADGFQVPAILDYYTKPEVTE